MAFLQWNNGTLGVLPSLIGLSSTQLPVPAISSPWGSFAVSHEHSWWSEKINFLVCSWFDNIYLMRVFPGTIYGKLNGREPKNIKADYGNVIDDIHDPWTVLNTFSDSISFGNPIVEGNTEGVAVVQRVDDPPVAPPNPPAPASGSVLPFSGTVLQGGELQLDVVIDGQSEHSSIALLGCFDWSVPPAGRPSTWELSAEQICFLICGQRAVLIDFLPDWKEQPPRVRFTVPDDLFESDDLVEQRATALPGPDMSDPGDLSIIRRITTQFKTDGRCDSTLLWSLFARILHRRCAVPYWVEPLTVSSNPFGVNTVTVTGFSLEYLTFESAEIVLFDRRDRSYETRRVTSIDRGASTVTVFNAWSKDVPPHHAELYMIAYCQIEGPPRRRWLSDQMQVIDVTWREV